MTVLLNPIISFLYSSRPDRPAGAGAAQLPLAGEDAVPAADGDDPRIEAAARVLGAGTWQLFLPPLRRPASSPRRCGGDHRDVRRFFVAGPGSRTLVVTFYCAVCGTGEQARRRSALPGLAHELCVRRACRQRRALRAGELETFGKLAWAGLPSHRANSPPSSNSTWQSRSR
jgi:hypothetical protein